MAPGQITASEAARRLGVDPHTFIRWIEAGHVTAWRTFGGHYRLDSSEVERIREERGRHGQGQITVRARREG